MTTTGLRERKKAATRTALHEAAVYLVAERGLAAVTTEAVAERADVSARTFFNYFASKEEAVLGRDPDRSGHLSAELAEALRRGLAPLDALEAVLITFLEDEQMTSEGLHRRMELIRREPLLLATSRRHWEQMTEALSAAVAEVTPRPYAELVVHVSTAAVHCSLLRWSEDRLPLADVVGAAFAQLRAGLPAPDPTPTDDLSLDLEP